MGDEEHVPGIHEHLRDRSFVAGQLLAAEVVEDGRERAIARRLVDEAVQRKVPAREYDFNGSCGCCVGRGGTKGRSRGEACEGNEPSAHHWVGAPSAAISA